MASYANPLLQIDEYKRECAALTAEVERLRKALLRKALPVAWLYKEKTTTRETLTFQPPDRVTDLVTYTVTPLYAAPPEATDAQLEAMVEAYEGYQSPADQGLAQQMEGMRLALEAYWATK